jgi:condensin complex subunit 1
VAAIAERELVAAAANLGGAFTPLLQHVALQALAGAPAAAGGANGDTLAQSALLALCKLMAISADYCEAHLQLLFTVLCSARSPSLRATIAIALGDLAFRFPNLVEPYTAHLYARLRDPDARVRKNTLMVLTHLILNDMVKVKGQVGEIAVCLNDPEPRIADLTRLVRNSSG